MAIVCTEKQFEDMSRENPSILDKEYVYLSATQVRNEVCGGVFKGALPKDGVAIIPQSCSAGYLSFLLNSMPAQYSLYEGKYNSKSKTKINKKLVSSLIIYDVEAESQNAYALADNLRSAAYDAYNENRDDPAFHRLYYLMSDLCTMLALELYAHPMFEEKGVFILESWKEVTREAADKGDTKVIFDALIKSDMKLRNEIMKAHLLIDDIANYINTKTDGLEDK